MRSKGKCNSSCVNVRNYEVLKRLECNDITNKEYLKNLPHMFCCVKGNYAKFLCLIKHHSIKALEGVSCQPHAPVALLPVSFW
jgi:hypothetical protein